MTGLPSTPETTLVAILGASVWPRAPRLPSSRAFAQSAEDLVKYFTDSELFALPSDEFHLLDLFDSDLSPSEINRTFATWLQTAQEHAAKVGKEARDLIVYYVGHGGFTPGGEQAFFIALKSTEAEYEGITSLRMSDLSRTITRTARSLRRFLILDCCFAEAAYPLFQSGSGSAADAAHEKARMDFPAKGTALLCSASARDVSITMRNDKYTMFSGALLEVLRTGDKNAESFLSLENIGRRVDELILTKYPDDAVRPKVSSPDEREGDIADIPLFPNIFLPDETQNQQALSQQISPDNGLTKVSGVSNISGNLDSDKPSLLLQEIPVIADQSASTEATPTVTPPVPPTALVVAKPDVPRVRRYRRWVIMAAILLVAATCYRYWSSRPEVTDDDADYVAKQDHGSGLFAGRNGNLDEAISYFSMALDIEPRYTDAYMDRGTAYLLKNNVESARKDFDKAIRLRPNYAEAHFNRGLVYDRQGQVKKAIEEYSTALAINPKLSRVSRHRGQDLIIVGNITKALADLTDAVNGDTSDLESRYDRARVYEEIGDRNKAIDDLRAGLLLPANNETTPKVREMLAELGFKSNLEGEIYKATKFIEMSPGNPALYIARGRLYMNSGDPGKGLLDFNQAVAFPSSATTATAFYLRGLVYMSYRDFDDAIADFGMAINANPMYSAARMQRAIAYYQKGSDYDNRAIQDLNRAESDGPSEFYVYYCRGLILSRHANYDGAISALTTALKLNPTSNDALLARGEALRSKGQFNYAIEDFTRVIASLPDQPTALYGRALAYNALQESAAAVSDLKKLLATTNEPFLRDQATKALKSLQH